MSGLYVYQTYDLQHPQNDCFLYGAGVDLIRPKSESDPFILSQSIGGYNGYLGIGDKPLVYRISAQLQVNNIDFKVSFTTGIRDYNYKCYSLGAVYHFNLQKLFDHKKKGA
jgi:hypothetical protein